MSCNTIAVAIATATKVIIEFTIEFIEEASFQGINLEEETNKEEPINNNN
jgi:hypothetical protein